jgi:hypothetical protein
MREEIPDCPRCHRRMGSGFLLETGHHNARRVTQWVEGAPEKTFWTGLKLGERQVLPVISFRCPRCGYLESYARVSGIAGAPSG